jgi:hypothetical protein
MLNEIIFKIIKYEINMIIILFLSLKYLLLQIKKIASNEPSKIAAKIRIN